MASKRSIYRLCYESNCVSIFDEGMRHTGLPTAWSMLKAYVSSKLRWNTTADVNALIEKYCYGVYGIAGKEMLDLYLSLEAHWSVLETKIESGEITVIINNNQVPMNNTVVWPLNKVKGWLDGYEIALNKIETLKETDKDEFDRINKLIRAERVSSLYMLIALNSAHFSDEELMTYKLEFKEDVLLSGLTSIKGNGTVAELLTQWGV